MSKKADNVIQLSKTLTLCEFRSGGSKGYWLYDDTRGMNLAMRAQTERDAFVEALSYYQDRLSEVENELEALDTKVQAFVSQFVEDNDNNDND